jgi:hypothetical protein
MRDADDDDDDDEPCGTARRTRDMLLHENHTCTLQVGGAHANHLGYQSKGPHCMWIAHCAQLPYALHFKTFEIENRLKTMRIDTTHQEVKKGHIVSTCQLHGQEVQETLRNFLPLE